MQSLSSTSTPRAGERLTVFFHALLFVLGFSAVFVIGWGGAATALGQLFAAYKGVVGQVGGLVVIFFGLVNLGVLRISWLAQDTRRQWTPGKGGGAISSLMMGLFFAAGWTPCIGTTLGAILTLGLSQQTSFEAMLLASGYALGLGLPFLAIGLAVDRALEIVRHFRRHIRTFEIITGLLLIAAGGLMLSGQMTLIAIWAQRNHWVFDLPLGGAANPTYFIALLAGLLSFLSPCVLPLVPAYIGYLSGHVLDQASR